jgi:LPS sulfotransferase NodH
LGEGGWFAFKAGATTMILGERLGFVPSYFPRMRFVVLYRRDLVAQAVSAAKANFTGRFHSTQAEEREATQADYDRATILKKMATMLKAMLAHDARARAGGRPWRKLFYEDFAHGDFACVEAACDALGLPRRPQIETGEHRTVTKIGDDVNEAWCRRFQAERDARADRILERYDQLISA